MNTVVGIVRNVFRRFGEVTEATESRYSYCRVAAGGRRPAFVAAAITIVPELSNRQFDVNGDSPRVSHYHFHGTSTAD